MKRMLVIIIFSLIIFCPQSSFALSCMPQPAEIHYLKSDYVLTAVVKKISTENKSALIELRRKKVYKGDVGRSFELSTDISFGNPFEKGEEYLVFASDSEEGMVNVLCSGTTLKTNADDMIKKIGTFQDFLDGKMVMIEDDFMDGQKTYQFVSVKPEFIIFKELQNGKIINLVSFVNGKRQGVSKMFFQDGALNTETYYKDGLRHGSHRVFDDFKALRTQGFWKNDERSGIWKEFDIDGSLKRETEYKGNGSTISKTYNDKGVLIKETTSVGSRTVNYKEYDDQGNLINEKAF